MNKKSTFIIGMAAAGLATAGFLAGCGESKLYKVTFYTGTDQVINPAQFEWGQIPTLPSDPVRTGYTFTGWYTDATTTNKYVVAEIENDINLYAGWSVNAYTVSFNLGYEGQVPAPITGNYGTAFTPDLTVSRPYFTFGGWYYDQAFEKPYKSTDTIPGENITMYAKWIANSYKISFNKNLEAASGTMDDWDVSQVSVNNKLPANAFKATGMDFVGWALEPNGEVVYGDQAVVTNIESNKDFTLYAKWAVKQLSAEFFATDSKTGRTISVSKTAPLAYGSEIPVPAENPSLIGHEFKGWGKMELTSDVQANIAKEYFQSLGGGVYLKVNINDKDNIAGKGYYEVKPVSMIQERINEDNNYYAIFNRVQRSIKFVSGLDGSEITTITGYFGTTIALPEKPVVPGYKASFWATDEACEEAFIGTTINFSSTDMTLYLKYVIGEYTLNYSLSDNTMEHATFHYGDVLNIDPIAKEGYVFKNWNTAKDGSGTSFKKGDALPDNDLTLYPVYEIKKFNVVFNADGIAVSEKLVDFDGEIEYPANPVKEGHNFDGWFEDTAFATPFNATKMPDVEGNVFNLYAKFVARSHDVSFNTDGGTTIESKLGILFGTNLSSIKPADPVKKGYTFMGWKESNGRLVDFATETMGDKDLNLVAIWKANNVDFKVSYWGTKLGDASVYVAIGDPHEITVSSYTDDAYTITDAPVIEGFTFNRADSISHVNADGTDELKVYYTRNNVSYTVTGVGDSEIVYTDIEYGSPFGAIPDTWYKTGKAMSFKVNGVDYADLASYVIKGGEVISVSYEDIPFGIRFIGNSGLVEGKDSVSHEYAYEDLVEFPTEVSKVGYTFKEWNTKADGSGTTINPEGYTMPAEAIDVYAIWTINQYTVDFVDEVGGPHTSVTADYGSTITIPVPSKAGYTFKGFTNKDGEELAADATTYTMPVDGDTLTAKWVEHTLTFEFNGNGATSGSMEDQVLKFSDDDADKKLNANQFVKEGHAFKGWSLDAKATSVDVVDEASYADFDFEAESSEITLYAVWEIQSYKLTLDYGNGSDPVVTEHVYGSALNAPELPTWEGHTFKGWYTKDASDKFTRYSFDRMPGEDLELFALWSETKYEVRFMTDGGSYVAPWKITNGQTLDGNSLATPTKTGYEFAGWFTKNGAGGDWGVEVTDATLSSYTINNADIVFYAKWAEKSHTITYYNPNGSVYQTYGDVKYGEVLTIPTDPTDSGKTFLGWYEYDPANPGVIGAYHDFTVDGLMKDSDINLIAKFDEAVYTISFYDENGNLIYSVPSNAADTSFLVYIQNLVKAQASYETIYDAILKAVESQVTEGKSGSINEITAVITYATLGGKSMPELFAVAQASNVPGQTETTAGYAAMTLGAASIATDGNTVLLDVGTTVAVLQTLDPTAITDQLTVIGTKAATDPVYGAVYAEILSAAKAALPEAMEGSNDATKITALGAYAGVVNELVVNQGLTTAPQLITYFASTQGADLSIASATITKLATNMAYADNPAYYNMIAEQGAAGIDTISMNTTAFLTEVSTTYQKYEANAYNPSSSDPNKYFDGWTTSISTNPEERYINNFPSFVSKASQTSNVQTYSSSNTTASFNWDAVDGAYGYKVRIEVNGAYKDTVTVRTNDIKIEGLSKGDTVTLSITTLLADSAGNLKETSKEYTATSVVDGSTLTVEAKPLASDPVEFNYIHTTENDIGKVSKFGDYYYLSEDDEGVQTYTFFTNTTYTFGGRPLTIVTPGAGITDVVHGESGDAIVTKGSTGMFKFTLDGVEKFGIVKSIPDSIASGSNFEKVENVTITNNTRSAAEYGSHDYLAETKSTYKVGAAATHVVSGSNIQFVKEGEQSYYNGFRFDVDTLATSGSRMAMDRNYKFEKLVDGQYVEVSNPDRLFFYDAEQDAFFFKATNNVENDNLGVYRVTITPKGDIKDGDDYVYINTDVPDKIKKDNAKMARLNKQIVFELTNGVNVYTSEGLRSAFADKSTSVINIQTNIEAEYPANAVAYVPWVRSYPTSNSVRRLVLGSNPDKGEEGLDKGDVDIVDGSAVMSTVEGVGPQIWVVDNSSPLFHDINGVGYSYSASGTHAIKTCKWTQNFDEGKFKTICKDYDDEIGNHINAAPYYLTTCQCYNRVGKGNVALTVNGNYFTVDASKIPFSRSNVKNTAGGTIATYEIQSLQTQVFGNSSDNVLTCNDMTVVSNTSNNSSILDEKTQNVAEIMRMTSGGMSAFRSSRAQNEGILSTQINLNSVNIYNSLIAMYADCGISANYVHVKNTWANGVYSWSEYDPNGTTVNLDHTVIESCGGCAVHLDDMEYGLEKWAHITNPRLNVNLDTCTIENFVSGDEQWFKGYSMEVVALGLKSTINSQLAAANKTIIKNLVNPVTGLEGEYMNWVFFDKTEEIANQGDKNAADIMCNVFFDANYFYNSAFGAYVKIDLTTGQPYVGPDGNLKVLQITDATGTPLAATDGANPQLPSDGDAAQCFIAYADISYASYAAGTPNPVITRQFLYFRQSQAPFGWIQGIVEAFDK